MIKLVTSVSKCLISTSLKNILTLKNTRPVLAQEEYQQKLQQITYNIESVDFDQFLEAYRQIDYGFKEIAAIYNQGLNAERLLQDEWKKREVDLILDAAYTKLMNKQSEQLQIEFDYSDLINHLDQNGTEFILKSTNCLDVKFACKKIIQNSSFYYQINKIQKKGIKQSTQAILKQSEESILRDINFHSLLYKVFLHQKVQISNMNILNHFSEQMSKQMSYENVKSRDVVVFTYVLMEWMIQLGFMKPFVKLIYRLDQLVKKTQLSLDEKAYILCLLNNKIDIQSKEQILCQPLSEEFQRIPLRKYADVFNVLCNSYAIKLGDHEKYIEENLLNFNADDQIKILQGFLYAECQNVNLIQKLLDGVITPVGLSKQQLAQQCRLYQIVCCYEKLYNLTVNLGEREQLKELYFNRTNLQNNCEFSSVEQSVMEKLKEIQKDLSMAVRPNWRIGNIRRNVMVGVFQIDFLVELEGVYRKRNIYIDVAGNVNGRQRLRYRMLKNEELRVIDSKEWQNLEDNKKYLEELLNLNHNIK